MKDNWREVLAWKEISDNYEYRLDGKGWMCQGWDFVSMCNHLMDKKRDGVANGAKLERVYMSKNEPVMGMNIVIYEADSGWNEGCLNSEEKRVLDGSIFRTL